jgi:hypothetical protein
VQHLVGVEAAFAELVLHFAGIEPPPLTRASLKLTSLVQHFAGVKVAFANLCCISLAMCRLESCFC